MIARVKRAQPKDEKRKQENEIEIKSRNERRMPSKDQKFIFHIQLHMAHM